MTKNVSSVDRVTRIILGLMIVTAGVYYQNYWGAIGLVALVTGMMGWCPAYSIFGISSCGTKHKRVDKKITQ